MSELLRLSEIRWTFVGHGTSAARPVTARLTNGFVRPMSGLPKGKADVVSNDVQRMSDHATTPAGLLDTPNSIGCPSVQGVVRRGGYCGLYGRTRVHLFSGPSFYRAHEVAIAAICLYKIASQIRARGGSPDVSTRDTRTLAPAGRVSTVSDASDAASASPRWRRLLQSSWAVSAGLTLPHFQASGASTVAASRWPRQRRASPWLLMLAGMPREAVYASVLISGRAHFWPPSHNPNHNTTSDRCPPGAPASSPQLARLEAHHG